METQPVLFTRSLDGELSRLVSEIAPDKIFVLADTNTRSLCLPLLQAPALASADVITIGAGDVSKNIDSLASVWESLSRVGATRRSLLVNLGGGMVTDLGGFAAATFKRGIAFINVPTTLLAMVDASVGGKTGINFCGLKNEIGVFRNAEAVLIDTRFLSTLDCPNMLSGFAEMLKHGLLSDAGHWAALLGFDLSAPDLDALQSLVERSVDVKRRVVEADPTERGIRKALNLGHTLGHAFESLAMEQSRPVLHGYAVAWGMVGELYLSATRCGLSHDVMYQALQFIRENYGTFAIDCKMYDRIYELMTHDKKNEGATINTTLLSGIGGIEINQPVSRDDITEMLDFYCDSMGC